MPPLRRPFAVAAVLLAAPAAPADNWPAWRGPTGQGTSAEKDLPTEWSATRGVRWKVALPGPGNSTPVVWGDKVFVTQATEKGTRRSLVCFARADGKQLWERTVPVANPGKIHATNTYCAASPATDGTVVVVSHGSAGLFCYDLGGKELWRRDLGPNRHFWGGASSPVIVGDAVVVYWGPGVKSFLTAVRKADGADLWRVGERAGKEDEYHGSWATPVVAEVGGKAQLVMGWPGAVKGHDPATGAELWACRGLEKDAGADRLTYASPLVGSGVVVAMAGYGGPSIGLTAGGAGDVTDTHRLWRTPTNPQRIGSGVIVGDFVYVVNEPGLACLELKTGKERWRASVDGGIWGSVVHAAGRLYVTTQKGETVVFAPNPKEFEVLARNKLDGATTRASVVPAGGDLFIRTYTHLWCVGGGK